MTRRDEWKAVLKAEVARWSALPWQDILRELHEAKAYEIESSARRFCVEVELLQNTDTQLQVMIAVDDGSLPASLVPATEIFVLPKLGPGHSSSQ